ncbi:pyruvate dehydrogenase complex transcriptional repressor PdhR [Aeromonas diversa]|uniref:pyruvate dehydrogenase complex transcriptional repressor PdhR n=1 Tax=Aeromonas diversa TaxID=502790 RepID=UPI00346218CF
MPYRKITQPKLADAIVAELENMILEGSLQPGQKLPPERELAIQFQVSRPSLREAVQRLEARGLLYRRQGGGTYVQNALSKGIADPLFELLSNHPEAQYDLLEFRHALEGICAYYAALRGTEADFERIRAAQAAIEESGKLSLAEESAAVTGFYLAVAEASHNVVLLHLLRAMGPMLEQNILQNNEILNRRPGVVAKIRRHRANLIEAILSGAPERARSACHEHLAFIEDTLLDMQREESRIQRSMRRIRQQ